MLTFIRRMAGAALVLSAFTAEAQG